MSRNNALASGGRARGALRPGEIGKGISRGKLEERPARRDLRSATLEAKGKEGCRIWAKAEGRGQKAKGALRPGEIVSEFHPSTII